MSSHNLDKQTAGWQTLAILADLNLCYLKKQQLGQRNIPVDLISAAFYPMLCWTRVIKKNKKNKKKKFSQSIVACLFSHTHKHTITFRCGGPWGEEVWQNSSFPMRHSQHWTLICKSQGRAFSLSVCQRDDNRSASSVLTRLSRRLHHKLGNERLLHRT